MAGRLTGIALGGLLLVGSACTAQRANSARVEVAQAGAPAQQSATVRASPTSPAAATTAATTPTTPPTTSPPTTVATTPPTTNPPTTTTTIPLPPGVHDPACARVIQPGESLSVIADSINDPTVTAENLRIENGIANPDLVLAGDLLDVCPGNQINDLTGEQRLAASAESSSGVAAQQRKLNELFAGYGLPDLAVDGVSGPFTQQRLCAARMALHLPISRDDMEPGSAEEQVLMSATSIAIPKGAATSASRWVLIDKTCQIMFAGEGSNRIRFVFKTSTGEAGWETRTDSWMTVRRYNPAADNNGWHNSTKFPVADDNPLNGNMYKPLYFHRGQAIHGANNVPPEPASKGCARLRPENQDALLAWVGLDGLSQSTSDSSRIGLVVSAQGSY